MNFGKNDRVLLDEMTDESLNGSEAIITDVYQPDGIEEKRYELFIQDHGPFAWVKEEQMELLERNQEELLEEWKEELDDLEDDE